MHYILVAIFAFSSAAALAQTVNGPNPFKIPPQGYALTAGKPSNIQWAPNTPGTVTIKLREGASSDLNAGKVIGDKIPNNGMFSYTPPIDTVRNSDYALEIISDSDPSKVNYTPQFVIESSNTVASITSSVTASSTSTSASQSSTNSKASTDTKSTMSTTSSAQTTAAMTMSTATTSGASSSTDSSSSGSTSTGTASAKLASAPSSGAGTGLYHGSAQCAFVAMLLGALAAW